MAKPSASQRAYAHAKARILDGRWPGGELVSEGDVAEALDLSRTPVREAFLLLEAEGLMRLYPKRGALVVPVSADEVEAVLETRMLVERFALQKALESDPAPLAEDLAADLERLGRADRAARFAEADRRFHRTIVAAAGNAIVLALYDSLRDRQQRMGTADVRRDPERAQRIIAEHEEIADAVRAGDGERALAALEAHLAMARAALNRPRAPLPPPA